MVEEESLGAGIFCLLLDLQVFNPTAAMVLGVTFWADLVLSVQVEMSAGGQGCEAAMGGCEVTTLTVGSCACSFPQKLIPAYTCLPRFPESHMGGILPYS